jgi:uncharacterized protein YdaU (DUF1376 family)
MSCVTKTPAFPFYGKDAYDDEQFARLSFAEQGVYMFLAWWQWQEGSIPANLELILDKVPRRKIAEARKVWPALEAWFPVMPDNPARRQNEGVERRRQELLTRRDRNREGANKTNAKRWGSESVRGSLSESPSDSQRSLSDSLSDTNSDSLRAASAIATGKDLKVTSRQKLGDGGLGEEGRGSPPETSGLDALGVVQHALEAVAPGLPADDFTASLWLRDICADPWWIAAAICQAELTLRKARSPGYVTSMLRAKKAEGWECEDAKGYVEFRMQSIAARAVVVA